MFCLKKTRLNETSYGGNFPVGFTQKVKWQKGTPPQHQGSRAARGFHGHPQRRANPNLKVQYLGSLFVC